MRLYNKKAGLFLEYAAILGLVGMVLFAMNTYFKRGIQARTKDMTDYFMSEGEERQVEEVDPEAKSKSTVESEAGMDVNRELALGGKATQQIDTKEERDVESLVVTTARESRSPDQVAFISSDAGFVPVAVRPEENQFNDKQLKEMEEIALAQKQQAEADLAACGGNQQCAEEAQARLDGANNMLTMINDLRGQIAAEPVTIADESAIPASLPGQTKEGELYAAHKNLEQLEAERQTRIDKAVAFEQKASDNEKEADELRRRVRESGGLFSQEHLTPQQKFQMLEQARALDKEARNLRKDASGLRMEAAILEGPIADAKQIIKDIEARYQQVGL
jgi:hypothetical protein